MKPGLEPVGTIAVDAICLDHSNKEVEAEAIYHKGLTPDECWWECPTVGNLGRITHWRNPRVLFQA